MPCDVQEDQAWRALESAHLADMVRAHPDGLAMKLSEGGEPLAAGQKQLVALARALLKRSRILVLVRSADLCASDCAVEAWCSGRVRRNLLHQPFWLQAARGAHHGRCSSAAACSSW